MVGHIYKILSFPVNGKMVEMLRFACRLLIYFSKSFSLQRAMAVISHASWLLNTFFLFFPLYLLSSNSRTVD